MKTMLLVLIFNNSGLITGSWHDLQVPWQCEQERKRIETTALVSDTPRTITVAYCVEPFKMKGWK